MLRCRNSRRYKININLLPKRLFYIWSVKPRPNQTHFMQFNIMQHCWKVVGRYWMHGWPNQCNISCNMLHDSTLCDDKEPGPIVNKISHTIKQYPIIMTVREHYKCCIDVERNFDTNQTSCNIFQHISTSFSTRVAKPVQHSWMQLHWFGPKLKALVWPPSCTQWLSVIVTIT